MPGHSQEAGLKFCFDISIRASSTRKDPEDARVGLGEWVRQQQRLLAMISPSAGHVTQRNALHAVVNRGGAKLTLEWKLSSLSESLRTRTGISRAWWRESRGRRGTQNCTNSR